MIPLYFNYIWIWARARVKATQGWIDVGIARMLDGAFRGDSFIRFESDFESHTQGHVKGSSKVNWTSPDGTKESHIYGL